MIFLLFASSAFAASPITWTATPGNFTVDSIDMGPYPFQPNENATVTIKGTLQGKVVTGGAVAWTLYRDQLPNPTNKGGSPYFVCDPHSCDPSKPIALTLSDPGSAVTTTGVPAAGAAATTTVGAGFAIYSQKMSHHTLSQRRHRLTGAYILP